MDESKKRTNACFNSDVTSLDLDGDSSTGNRNYVPIATTDQAMSVPYTGTAFQTYSEKNTPCNHR